MLASLTKSLFYYLQIQEGAEGLLQAIVLSFAGLQFTAEHLELNLLCLTLSAEYLNLPFFL